MSNDKTEERAAFEAWFKRGYSEDSLKPMESGCYLQRGAGMAWDAWQARAALSSRPVQGGKHPSKCPITGRPFFMAIEHPRLGNVATYGGPYDSYTIPHAEGEPHTPWHERDLACYRYDHDLGGWTDGTEAVPLRIIHEDVLFSLEERSSAPAREPMTDEQVEPMFRARKATPTKGIKDEWYWYSWGVEDSERHHGICKE